MHAYQSIPTGFPGFPSGDAAVQEDCAVSGDSAACTLIQSASGSILTTFLTTESVGFVQVQVATTAAPASSTSGSSSSSSSGSSSGNESGSGTETSSATTTAQTGSGNGAERTAASFAVVGVLGAVGMLVNLLA